MAKANLATHPAVTEILRMPGYCYWKPTALDVEANYGTLLGMSETGVDILIGVATAMSRAEERGEEPVAKWYLGARCQIRVTFKNWNAGVLARMFPGLSSGANIKYPNTIIPGTRLDSSTYSGHFLFMPLDDTAINKCALFQYASPSMDANGRVRARLNEDTTLTCVLDGFRHPSASGATELAYATAFVGDKDDVTIIT